MVASFRGGMPYKQPSRAISGTGFRSEELFITHGHIDHIHNIQFIQEKTNAWIAAPRDDRLHYRGKYPYPGISKVCGMLEALGRATFGFKEFQPDKEINDGDEFDIWGGLTAVHLPGHTIGHTGFYSKRKKLLFSGDLFASYRFRTMWPPVIFNTCPEKLKESQKKVLDLDLDGILPNHGDKSSPKVHLERFKRLNVLST